MAMRMDLVMARSIGVLDPQPQLVSEIEHQIDLGARSGGPVARTRYEDRVAFGGLDFLLAGRSVRAVGVDGRARSGRIIGTLRSGGRPFKSEAV